MIIVRAPLRLELLGGGTDIEYFYKNYTGRVLNTTIDKCVYVAINRKFGGDIRVSYAVTENVDHRDKIKHSRVKAALEHFGIDKGIEVVSIADVPLTGSGLGSSSSFMVGLTHGLGFLLGKRFTREELAEIACHLEINVLKEPIGKQDQYAAAFGGINVMTFYKDGRVAVKPVFLEPHLKNKLHNHILIFYTGITRSASEILKEQSKNLEEKIPYLKQMADFVPPAVKLLIEGEFQAFARLLNDEWKIKKNLASGISNEIIETMYKKAIDAGAWGGRVSGAGGGGFLVLLAPPQKHEQIKQALNSYKLTPVKLTEGGSQIVFTV